MLAPFDQTNNYQTQRARPCEKETWFHPWSTTRSEENNAPIRFSGTVTTQLRYGGKLHTRLEVMIFAILRARNYEDWLKLL